MFVKCCVSVQQLQEPRSVRMLLLVMMPSGGAGEIQVNCRLQKLAIAVQFVSFN